MNLYSRLLKGLILCLCCTHLVFAGVAEANAETSFVARFTQYWQTSPFFSLFNTDADVIYRPSFTKQSPLATKIYKVGIHPLHNPKRLFEVYAPIIDLFNAQIPQATFILEASRNYDEFEKKLYAGYFDFALPNPYQTINALKHGYHVFAKMGDDYNFRGIILVRKDSQIKHVSDLKGKVVAYPAPTALAATLMPQYYLQTHGININKDIENLYVGSQESSIMNVLNGDVAAAATWPIPWMTFEQKNPQLAEQLDVKWQTESLLNNSWMARDTMPTEMIAQVRQILLDLPQTSQGKAILENIPISKFETANDSTYDPVNAFVTRFNETVRPLN